MLDGRLCLTAILEPVGSSLVEGRDRAGLLVLFKLAPQELLEEVVIAVPAAVVVERDEEQVRLLESLQPERGILPLEHGIAERAAHRVQHGRPPEEGTLLGGQLGEVLGTKIVGQYRSSPPMSTTSVDPASESRIARVAR